MSLHNFKDITGDLTDDEAKLIPVLISSFNNHGATNPIKAKEIVKLMNNYLLKKGILINFTGVRLRKCVNYIRKNSMIPLMATSNGYFVSRDQFTIQGQIQSLRQRANSISSCADGLEKFLFDNDTDN